MMIRRGIIDYKTSRGDAGTKDLPDRFNDLKHDIDVFQSECIQNILDARGRLAKQNDKPVQIEFVISRMSTEQVRNISEMLGAEYFEKLTTSAEKSGSRDIKSQMRRVRNAIDNKDNWLSLIIIEKNTTGLTGVTQPKRNEGQTSKFDALMRSFGKSDKDEAISGGTFGKGSSVYTYTSGIWTWFGYSCLEEPSFETNDQGNDVEITHRFMGRGIIAPYVEHNDEDRNQDIEYIGHRWYCKKKFAMPFENDEADEQASAFGIPLRGEKDYGTSYLIPAFSPDLAEEMNALEILSEFRDKIVRNWFIPIYQGELICTLSSHSENFDPIEINKQYISESVPELRYKLQIIDHYLNGKSVESKIYQSSIETSFPGVSNDYVEYYAQAAKRQKGKVDLIIAEVEDESFSGFGTINRVGLTRNNGMIINHYPYKNDEEADENDNNQISIELGNKKIEAILFCGRKTNSGYKQKIKDHVDIFLALAEPPAHNKWINQYTDYGQCRFQRFDSKDKPHLVVNKIYKGILKEIVRHFPKDDNVPTSDDVPNIWKKLAAIKKSGSRSGTESLVHYKLHKQGYEEMKYAWHISFTSNSDKDELLITVDPYFQSINSGKERSFDELGVPEFRDVHIEDSEGHALEQIVLEPGGNIEVKITTCEILSKSIYKNFQPVIELKSEKIKPHV